MAFSMGSSSHGLTSEPNMTPMIDVLLVLLIIFMMIVPASRKTIDIQLPDPNPTQTPPSDANPDQIVLEVLPNSYFEVNNQAVSGGRDGLAARLREIYDGRPDKLIFVKGAPDVKYQDVIFAMDQARAAGVKVIGIPPGSADPPKVGK
jgi:biopolymer transport protein ExbD